MAVDHTATVPDSSQGSPCHLAELDLQVHTHTHTRTARVVIITENNKNTPKTKIPKTNPNPKPLTLNRLFVCLGFNGTFSTNRLYRAIRVG